MKKGLIFGGVGIVLVAVAVIGTMFFMNSRSAQAEKAEPTPVHVEGKLGPTLVLKDRVFNLAPAGGQKHFLKMQTTIEFETTDPAWFKLTGKELEHALEEFEKDEIGALKDHIEDIITTVVSGKKVEEISSAEGKAALREEILEAIHEEIHHPVAYRVFFTSFVTD